MFLINCMLKTIFKGSSTFEPVSVLMCNAKLILVQWQSDIILVQSHLNCDKTPHPYICLNIHDILLESVQNKSWIQKYFLPKLTKKNFYCMSSTSRLTLPDWQPRNGNGFALYLYTRRCCVSVLKNVVNVATKMVNSSGQEHSITSLHFRLQLNLTMCTITGVTRNLIYLRATILDKHNEVDQLWNNHTCHII